MRISFSIVNFEEHLKNALGLHEQPEAPLMAFDGSSHTDVDTALPFTLQDYFDLVDKTGRIIREGVSVVLSLLKRRQS